MSISGSSLFTSNRSSKEELRKAPEIKDESHNDSPNIQNNNQANHTLNGENSDIIPNNETYIDKVLKLSDEFCMFQCFF